MTKTKLASELVKIAKSLSANPNLDNIAKAEESVRNASKLMRSLMPSESNENAVHDILKSLEAISNKMVKLVKTW